MGVCGKIVAKIKLVKLCSIATLVCTCICEKNLTNLVCSISSVFGNWLQWNPLNGHLSTTDTHNITDNSESPDCPSIHFNTYATLNSGHPATPYNSSPNCTQTTHNDPNLVDTHQPFSKIAHHRCWSLTAWYLFSAVTPSSSLWLAFPCQRTTK